jgi:hypothetical protein
MEEEAGRELGTPMTLFETEIDLLHERAVADVLEILWRCQLVKRAPTDPCDYNAVRDDKLMSVIEIKCRTSEKARYPTVYVSHDKRNDLLAEGELLGVPALWVVRFTDMLCYIDAGKITGSVTLAGRPPRAGSTKDQEKMIELDIQLLSNLRIPRPARDAFKRKCEDRTCLAALDEAWLLGRMGPMPQHVKERIDVRRRESARRDEDRGAGSEARASEQPVRPRNGDPDGDRAGSREGRPESLRREDSLGDGPRGGADSGRPW